MKIRIQIVIIVCVLQPFLMLSQQTKLKKAIANYTNFAYAEAIVNFKEVIKEGNGTIEVYQKLGNCYFFNANLKAASRWYTRMLEKYNELHNSGKIVEEIDPEYYFRTSQSLKYLQQYKKADSLMRIVKDIRKGDSRVQRLLDNPAYLEEIALQSDRYQIEIFSRNSAYTDFAPSLYQDQLVFSSSRGSVKSSSKKNEWTQQPYLDLFGVVVKDSIAIEYPKKFSKKLNSRLHESTTSFTKDGKKVYFTRNNLLQSNYGKDSTGVNRLKIYRAVLDEQFNWTAIQDLSFNDEEYSVAHPALSPDEKKLYFASDMPGGYGMSDLYVVTIHEDGTFGTPENLGPHINTEGRDTFPFISKTGILYFSSDGHLGLGGLDIFTTNFEDIDKKVYNVGEPINSIADDVTFIINDDTRQGYFASNRTGGRGDDDIYSFVETTPLITNCEGSIEMIIIDEDSGAVLSNAAIEIKDETGAILFTGVSDETGGFSKDVDCAEKTYEIIIKKADFHTRRIQSTLTREIPTISEHIQLKKDLPEKGIDLAKLLNLKPIYFASGKSLILGKTALELDKLVAYMKAYASIRIEIGSHTDSRGSDRSNLKLSKRRATSTANYIISKGVDPSRVKSRGYGETVLINRCDNGVRCSKEEHGQNRRSEFIVVEN